MKHIILSLSAFIVLSLANGCASVMSKTVLANVDRTVDVTAVQAYPAAYAGGKVIWGGFILDTKNLESTSEIEVLETGLNFEDMPDGGASKGRFIIASNGFLDPNIYKIGFGITVVGQISGTKTGKIGQMSYLYPVVLPLEIKTFDLSKPALPPPYPYPSPWWGYPYSAWGRPYGPFYEPYYDPFYNPYYDPFYGP